MVDDNLDFLKTLKDILLPHFPSASIHEAHSGEETVQKVEERFPDLIFMDIGLPGANGLATTRQIKAKRPDIPILILTSYDSPEFRRAAAEAGADGFLSKNEDSSDDIILKARACLSDSGD
jgi:DNA-binding NarL/FixJ family response regulator